MNMLMRSLLLSALSTHVVYSASTECTIDGKTITCYHGSTCKTGEADFSMFPPAAWLEQTSENGLHCDCSTIYSGLAPHTSYNCNHKYEICPNYHICFHGAPCVPESNGNDTTYSCDCSQTTRGDIQFEGNHCEIRIEETPPPSPVCDLDCFGRGRCKFGQKDYGIVTDVITTQHTDKDGMYCECNDGFTGVQCETYLNTCGDSYCLNSARCTVEGDKGTCDCSTITSDTLPIEFSGKHCQIHEGAKKCFTFGNYTDPLDLFCINNGICRANNGELGCKCLDEYTGFRCEHEKQGTNPTCNLQCKNGGNCVNGIADFGFANDFELSELEKKHIDFKHCECPSGFTGVLCDIKLEVCGDNEFVCAFGSKCVSQGKDQDGKEKFTCDCDAAHTVLTSFAGTMCEYASTSFCAASSQPTPGDSSHAFCTNGGTCIDIVTPVEAHPECQCPVGFTGKHCEFKVEKLEEPKPAKKSSKATSAFLSLLILSLVGLVAAVIFMQWARRRDAKESEGPSQDNYAPNESNVTQPGYPNEANVSDNDNGMIDVEII